MAHCVSPTVEIRAVVHPELDRAMVVTQAMSGNSQNGPRPMNVNRDARQVMSLLETVFRPTLGPQGRRALRGSLALGQQPNFLLRISQLSQDRTPGFVWEEDGRIIGNVSLLMTELDGRFLIANVAVHPEFRRRGIARRLMEVTLDHVRGQSGHVILLQVKKENEAAKRLYRDLGFVALGDVTTWTTSHGALRTIPTDRVVPEIRLLRPDEWRDAAVLDRSSVNADLDWPQPLAADTYRRGMWDRIKGFFSGQTREVWVAPGEYGQLLGLGSIGIEYGRPYELRLRIHPEQRGALERPLLAKLIRRLRYLRRRQIKIEHPAHDEMVNQLLIEANLRPRRTLTTMKLTL